MNKEDIIRMAQEADGYADAMDIGGKNYIGLRDEYFAALVAAAEREACAKTCEAQENQVVQRHPARVEFDPDSMMARKCATAIRTRGQP